MKIWRPYTQMQDAIPPARVSHALGAHIFLQDGQRLFDGISSWWLITHGHCEPRLMEAIRRQTERLEQVVFANFVHQEAEELSTRLAGFLPPRLNRLFFSDNGSTAVEVAMKMAYQSLQQSGKKRKRSFLTFAKAYHGDTCGAMSASGDSAFTEAYTDLRFPVFRFRQPKDLSPEWRAEFRAFVEAKHEEIAALILEPLLQGAGGMIIWPAEIVREISEICRAHGILLIFDEVMTGFGRTGKMFAFEKVGVVPDLLCLSKGLTGGALPLALTVATEEIFSQFLSPQKLLFHGHSFTGNALSCAAANANLKIFQEETVLEKIAVLENAHRRALEKFALPNPRVLGSMGAIELPEQSGYGSAKSQELYQKCFSRGLFLRPLGNTVYLLPPYCASSDDIENAWGVVAEVLSENRS